MLAYDDLRIPVFQPAAPKQNKGFTTGQMRHAPAAAIYYLVGGEATQEALYQEHLEYLNTHFGISIQPPTHTEQWGWPSSASLSPQIPGNFRQLPYPTVQSYFQTIHHKSYHIGLKQGYSPPKPRPRYKGTHTLQAPSSQWQHIPVDPTEVFFTKAKDVAQAKRQIILEALPCIPSAVNLFAESAKVVEGLLEWDMDKLVDLNLWGSPQEDETSLEEQLAQERARRRVKGFRSPSPPRFSNTLMPSMLEIVDGKGYSF